jgi:hypothetical protein
MSFCFLVLGVTVSVFFYPISWLCGFVIGVGLLHCVCCIPNELDGAKCCFVLRDDLGTLLYSIYTYQ